MSKKTPASLNQVLSDSLPGEASRKIKCYVPVPGHEAEVAEIIRKVERDGPGLIREVVESPSWSPFAETIVATVHTEKLWAEIDFGLLFDGHRLLYYAAWFKIFRKRDEKKLVEVVTRRMVDPERAKGFKRLQETHADYALAFAEFTGALPPMNLGRRITEDEYNRKAFEDVVELELRRNPDVSYDEVLKALDNAPDIVNEYPPFKKWQAKYGIVSWGDIKKHPETRRNFQALLTKRRTKLGIKKRKKRSP